MFTARNGEDCLARSRIFPWFISCTAAGTRWCLCHQYTGEQSGL